MSYTEVDWLHDAGVLNHETRRALWDRMIEDGRCIVRTAEHGALIEFARAKLNIVTPEDEDRFYDSDAPDDLQMALIHWSKERRDWISDGR